jgi:2',3'-cyclic-nucleotide 2'-phosphodiesterase (5'-nucleotidase family)
MLLMRARNIALPACIIAAIFIAAAQAQNADVTILHVNDVYEISPVRGEGGLAELMTLLKGERSRHANTLTAVSGDFLSPSLLSGTTKGAQMVELFNAMGVDVATFGNHEFDFGRDVLLKRIAEAKFAWLGTNVTDPAGQPLAGTVTTAIKQVGDVKIGFLGVVTAESAMLSSGGPDIRFGDPVATAKAAVEALRKAGVNAIVALTHLDYEQDRALSRAVPEISLILGGHDHDPITFYEHGVLVQKSGSDAHFLGAIDLEIRTEQGAKGAVTTVRHAWRMIANHGIAADTEIAAVVKKYNDQLDRDLGQVIGTITVELDSRVDTVRSGEARIGNLIADALRDSTGADVAITNGGGIRGNRTYDAGSELTRKDVLKELPFGNTTLVIELTGAQLKEALENGVSQVEDKAGRFPQVSGLRVVYDPRAAAGQRIRTVTVGGEPLDMSKTYRVATNDYMARGGDGYAAFTKGKVITDARYAQLMATTVMEYIVKKGQIAPTIDGRIASVN